MARKNNGLIVAPKKETSITTSSLANIDYPVFCFKHLQKTSFSDCNDAKLLRQFFERTKKLGELGWSEILKSAIHSFGAEPVAVDRIKPRLPNFITPDVKCLYAYRYGGNNLPFVCLRNGNVLHVIFIETKHGDIYDHGSK